MRARVCAWACACACTRVCVPPSPRAHVRVRVSIGWVPSRAACVHLVCTLHVCVDQYPCREDQRFAVVGSWLSRRPVLETPQEFVDAIETKLSPERGREKSVELIHVVRKWKDFLSSLQIGFHGHTGPKSPHCFRFCRECDLLLSGRHDCVRRAAPELQKSCNDVVLLTKHHMADSILSQPPLVVLTTDAIHKLDIREMSHLNPECRVHLRSPMEKSLIKEYRKTAQAISLAARKHK